MDFKKLSLLLLLPLVLAACTDPTPSIKEDENLIGTPLQAISTLSKSDGTDSEQVAIFDETTRKIHQFRLSDMTFLKSYEVPLPEAKHTVLVHDQGNYVIDLADKALTVFSKDGSVERDPITLQGHPLSAAFRSDLNLLVAYDDLNSVGILQLSPAGLVNDSWVGGPYFGTDQSISAGDLLSDGSLVLALTDGTLAVIDVTQTLSQQKWVLGSSFASGLLGKISWLAPVADNPHHILVKTDSEIALFDISTQSRLDLKTVSGSFFEKLSKASEGHIVLRSSSSSSEIQVYYAQSSKIQSRSLNRQKSQLMSSHLNSKLNRWSYVEMANYSSVLYLNNDLDYQKQGRILKSVRLSDMTAEQRRPIVDNAQALLSPSYIFALFPSELGYAARFDILTGEKKEAKFFNVGSLHH